MSEENNNKNGKSGVAPKARASALGIVLGSLATGVAAMTLGVLAPHLQTSKAAASQPVAIVEPDLFPVRATFDAMTADDLRAIEAQLAEAEARLARDDRRAAVAAARMSSWVAEGG
ncbi:MAG: hypothetical protein NW203_15765 [Hyphomonadaceae bacterium]|nr:hypothetical protein [Hyphomonadaceae bacterium]